MAIVHVNKENYTAEVVQADRPVLIDFWATWCGPCRMLAPVMEKIAEACPEYKVCKVNVDEEPELAAQFGVSSIPMVAVMRGGKLLGQLVGYRPKEALLDAVSAAVSQ